MSESRSEKELELINEVKQACIKAASSAFQDAAFSGLCLEGAIEAAIGAIQSINIESLKKSTSKN